MATGSVFDKIHDMTKSTRINARFAGTKTINFKLIWVIAFCLILLLAEPVTAQSSAAVQSTHFETSTSTSLLPEKSETADLMEELPEGVPDVDAEAYVLYDAQSRTFLAGRNQRCPLPPASITKVMTVLLALERLDVNDTITIQRDMFESIPNDYNRLGFVEGEIISVETALQASLLISANDAAMALGIEMGGTEAGFADMMNARARELGCTDTHFTNPYGYADENHLTTACDMALITAQALKHELFCTITTMKHAMIEPTNLIDESRGLPNGNRFVSQSAYAYEPYIGGKTGYTALSRYTIVSGARKDGRVLVGVILGASNSPVRYQDMTRLFEYGFSETVNDAVKAEEFASLKNKAVDQIKSLIASSCDNGCLESAEMNVVSYVTTTTKAHKEGYDVEIGLKENIVLDDKSEYQHIEYPLYRTYHDKTKIQVGTLDLTIRYETALSSVDEPTTTSLLIQPTETVTGAVENASDQLHDRWLLMVLVILVFIAGALILAKMIQNDLKKKKKKKGRPRVL